MESCGDDRGDDEYSLTLFNDFIEATDLPHIISSFSSLCNHLSLHDELNNAVGGGSLRVYTLLKNKLQHWKCKALWKLLDTRASQSVYGNGTVCSGKRLLVVGAGPVGLRTAIEGSLLGASVDVIEKRDSFTRNNVLHLWPYLIDDLKSLGAKKFYGKFCAGAIDHISIKILQCIVTKICLILGVRIHFPFTFQDIIEPQSDTEGWRVLTTPSNAPISTHFYDAIIAADGKQYSLPGFKSKEFRAKLAIAITVNFVNRNTQHEAGVEEISGVAFIYNQSFFKSLAVKHGIELENIVYYKDETHYFVMTAKKTSLLEKGVIKNDYKDPDMLLSYKNIDQSSLESFAKEAVTYSTKGALRELEFAINHKGNNDVAIFDFTSLFASVNASRIMERKGKRILLCVAGDTLLEPFWPTGSGLARGFLGAMDSAWMLKRYSEGVAPLELIEEREGLFRLLPSTTPESLHKKTSCYSINPMTRYPNIQLITTNDVSYLFDSDTKPCSLIDKEERGAVAIKVKRSHTIQSPTHHGTVAPILHSTTPSLSPLHSVEITPGPHEELAVAVEEKPSPAKKSSEFALFKFAKLLFGRKVKPPEEGKEVKPTVKSPERKRKKSREKRKSVSKLQEEVEEKTKEQGKKSKDKAEKKEVNKGEQGKNKAKEKEVNRREQGKDKTKEREELKNVASNDDKNALSLSSRDKQGETSKSGVYNLKQLYESNSFSAVNKPTTTGMMSTSTIREGGIADVIKQYELRDSTTVKGGANMIDGPYPSLEECNGSSEVDKVDEPHPPLDGTNIKYEVDMIDGPHTPLEECDEINDGPHLPLEECDGITDESSIATSSNISLPSHDECINKKERVDSKDDTPPIKDPLPPKVTSPLRRYMSHDDTSLQTRRRSHNVKVVPQWVRKLTGGLTKCLELLREESPDLYNVKNTLEVLKFIYNNIINDSEEDTYRRVLVSNTHFTTHVYQYSGAQQFLWLSGWMQVGDYLLLPLEQSLDIPMKVLERQLETVELMLHSVQFDSIIHRPSVHLTSGGCYTDQVVLEALSKIARDHSKMMASVLKEQVTAAASPSIEYTDSPTLIKRISRGEEMRMMESASLAREWWENKEEEHNNYLLYFKEEEIEEMKYIANVIDQKGVVADRIKTFEHGNRTTSSSFCEERKEERDKERDHSPLPTVSKQDDSLLFEKHVYGQQQKEGKEQYVVDIEITKNEEEEKEVPTDSLHLKWLQATRAYEKTLEKRQQQNS